MTIREEVNSAPKAASIEDAQFFYIRGSIENDHNSGYFRLYQNPAKRDSYLLIRMEDILEDRHPTDVGLG